MAKTAAEATKGLHGKADDKPRPRAERLAHIDGVTTFRDPREARGGGWIDVTDLDMMAAVAMSRMLIVDDDGQRRADPTDCGPEILETYYGSTQRHRKLIATRYLAYVDRKMEGHGLAIDRIAALIAVQRLGGCQFSADQWAELAWMAVVGKQTFCDKVNDALAWMEGERDRAKRLFDAAFREIQEQRTADKAAHWQDQRERRLAGKRIPRALRR